MKRLFLTVLLGLSACHHHVRPPVVLENGQFEYTGGTRRPEKAFAKFEQQAANYCAAHGHQAVVIDTREQMPTPHRTAVAMRFHCGEVAGPVPTIVIKEPAVVPSPSSSPGTPPPPPPASNPNAMQELDEEE